MGKLITLPQLLKELSGPRAAGRKIVFTNGCFDILHVGHVRYLQDAKKHGDILVVGLNSDRSVRAIKGPSRPINPEKERAEILAALSAVDYVVLFDEKVPFNLVKAVMPGIYVKGSDYSEAEIPEAKVIRAHGGKVILSPLTKGKSTSALIERIKSG